MSLPEPGYPTTANLELYTAGEAQANSLKHKLRKMIEIQEVFKVEMKKFP